MDVKLIDSSTVDGMAEAAFYELMEKPTPILVVDDDPTIGAINILHRLKELSEE